MLEPEEAAKAIRVGKYIDEQEEAITAMMVDQRFRLRNRTGYIHRVPRMARAYRELNSFLNQRMVVRDQYPPNRHLYFPI